MRNGNSVDVRLIVAVLEPMCVKPKTKSAIYQATTIGIVWCSAKHHRAAHVCDWSLPCRPATQPSAAERIYSCGRCCNRQLFRTCLPSEARTRLIILNTAERVLLFFASDSSSGTGPTETNALGHILRCSTFSDWRSFFFPLGNRF